MAASLSELKIGNVYHSWGTYPIHTICNDNDEVDHDKFVGTLNKHDEFMVLEEPITRLLAKKKYNKWLILERTFVKILCTNTELFGYIDDFHMEYPQEFAKRNQMSVFKDRFDLIYEPESGVENATSV